MIQWCKDDVNNSGYKQQKALDKQGLYKRRQTISIGPQTLKREELFDILDLLTHLFDQYLQLDGGVGDVGAD